MASAGKVRLHLPAIPHTVTTDEYSHCAFTGKVLRFAKMMKRLPGQPYEVYHYGVEGSDSGADVHVSLFGREEWEDIWLASFKALFPAIDPETARDPTRFSGDMARVDSMLYREFNSRFAAALAANYRGSKTDVVCLPFGTGHQAALAGRPGYTLVETGIGYSRSCSFAPFRVYESFAWLHAALAQGEHDLARTFVVPNFYDADAWPRGSPAVDGRPRVGFLGRICPVKGLGTVARVALACPDVDFVMCGQGDPRPFLVAPNITYEPPIHGSRRAAFLGSLHALLAPSDFVEPFCGVTVEAQLCGTPVVAPARGGCTETVEHDKTGVLAHTVADYVAGVRACCEGRFDREYTRTRAARRFGLDAVALQYHAVFQTVLDPESCHVLDCETPV